MRTSDGSPRARRVAARAISWALPGSRSRVGTWARRTGYGFAKCGRDVVICPRAEIIEPGSMEIGDSVLIDDFTLIMATGGVRLGSFIHIGSHAFIGGGGGFTMEDFSGLSGGVRIYTGNEDYLGGQLTNPTVPAPWRVSTRKPVTIRRHAIIGTGTVILPGVTIGEGAAVGSMCLVTRDLDPWTVYAGSPARAVKERPSARILELEADLRRSLYDESGKYIRWSAR